MQHGGCSEYRGGSVGLVCHLIGVSVISEIDLTSPDSEFVVFFSRPHAIGLLSYLPQKISRLQKLGSLAVCVFTERHELLVEVSCLLLIAQ